MPSVVDALARARVAVLATFSAHAVVAGTVGPWIPRVKADAGLDAGGLGIALAGYALGLVAGTRVAGPAMRRAGARPTVRVGMPLLAASLAALPVAGGLGALIAIFAVLGIASGALDVAMNTEAVDVERRAGRRLMSGMHGMWSVSMLVGAGLASIAIAADVRIEAYLPTLAVVLTLASFPLLRWLPSPHEIERDEPAPDAAAPARSPIPRVLALCLIGFASFMTEGIAAEWSAVYLHESLGASAGVAGLGVVAFSAGMAASRFVGDGLATRFGPRDLVRIGTAIAAAVLAVALAVGGPPLTIAALAVVGMGVGPTVPMAFGAAGRLALGPGRTALGVVVTAGYVGSIVGPLAVGFVAEISSLTASFTIPVAACVAVAIAADVLRVGGR
jgi:MFS family permease